MEVINLIKGQTIDLRKGAKGQEDVYDLSTVTIGLGWDVRETKKGFFEKLLAQKEEDYDLDAIAFLLDANGKVADLGKTVLTSAGTNRDLYQGDVIYFNSLQHPSGHIWLTGDNRTGDGDGDDEQIIVKLDSLSQNYQRILFIVSIYQGLKHNQHFGMLDNAFIRAVDAKGKEIAKYSLSGDASLNNKCSMVFAEVYRKDKDWKFRAISDTFASDNFIEILKKYMY